MHIKVNDVSLFFDVEGVKWMPDGSVMREKPTLLLLHGGPGVDHTIYKPLFSSLSDIAQVVYLDHRGNGRSDRASEDSWNLNQWADDVQTFCQQLGIIKPIVLGISFGGMVALAYATRHPAHPGRLVLVSTEAKGGQHLSKRVELFARLGGESVGELARRRLIDRDTDDATLADWLKRAVPLYTHTPMDPEVLKRSILHADVTRWFTREGGEWQTFDLLPTLANIQCPTLLMGGEDDPMTPIECQEDIAESLPARLVDFVRFPNCGHGVLADDQDGAMTKIRQFITAYGSG